MQRHYVARIENNLKERGENSTDLYLVVNFNEPYAAEVYRMILDHVTAMQETGAEESDLKLPSDFDELVFDLKLEEKTKKLLIATNPFISPSELNRATKLFRDLFTQATDRAPKLTAKKKK